MSTITGGFSTLHTMLREWKSNPKGSPGHGTSAPVSARESLEENTCAVAENTVFSSSDGIGISKTNPEYFRLIPQKNVREQASITSKTLSILQRSTFGNSDVLKKDK
jgi:hypothetical protein